MKQIIILFVSLLLSLLAFALPTASPRSSKATLKPSLSPTQTHISPPELNHKRQDTTVIYSNDLTFTSTYSIISVITSSAIGTTIFDTTPTDSSTSTWNGGTTIENTGTLTLGGGTQTLTFGGQTITVTFPSAAATSEAVIEERELLGASWITQSNLPVATSWYNGGPSRSGGLWTTGSSLPVVTSWLNGGPRFSLTFGAEADVATSGVEVEKRQITWDTTLPITTYWGGDQTITIGGETITFDGGPEVSLTIGPDDAMITVRPTIRDEDLAKRQVGVIITGGPWTEDDGTSFTDYWGLPGQVVTLLGPHGDETLTLSGTPRNITVPVTASSTGIAKARITQT